MSDEYLEDTYGDYEPHESQPQPQPQPGDPHTIGSREQVTHALEVLRRYGVTPTRGDSFDGMGSPGSAVEQYRGAPDSFISQFLTNPREIVDSLGLTPRQAKNVKSIITGGGAGTSYKYLSKYIGGELAGALGGFLGAYISHKLMGR